MTERTRGAWLVLRDGQVVEYLTRGSQRLAESALLDERNFIARHNARDTSEWRVVPGEVRWSDG